MNKYWSDVILDTINVDELVLSSIETFSVDSDAVNIEQNSIELTNYLLL